MTESDKVWTCPKCGKAVKETSRRCVWCFEKIVPVPGAPNGSATESHTAAERIGADTPLGSNAIVAAPEVAPLPSLAAPIAARSQYRYHVVPFMGTVKSGFFSSDNAETVSSQLQNVIDRYAQQGWEFYSLEKVGIEVTPGCMGRLLGQSASYIMFDQLIFRQVR